MCTLTVFPFDIPGESSGKGLRFVMNRDEQRTREPALPPLIRACGDRSALMPIDSESGGSWIGGNDAGLVACLLNAMPTPSQIGRFRTRRSRGEIVPMVLSFSRVSEALQAILSRNAGTWPPFRLLLATLSDIALVSSDGRSMQRVGFEDRTQPLMLASSGLGDALVQRPRQAALQEATREHTNPCDIQNAFHAHQGSGPSATSVVMSRADARTVCRTRIELSHETLAMHHELLDDELRVQPATVLSIPLSNLRLA